MTENVPTNVRISDLLQEQTYAERMELANFLANAVSDWEIDGNAADGDYFASLLENWMPDDADEDASS